MTIEAVRDALHANQPFKVLSADGRSIDVPHSNFAMLSRSGRLLHISLENDHTEVIDLLLVTSIQKKNGAAAEK